MSALAVISSATRAAGPCRIAVSFSAAKVSASRLPTGWKACSFLRARSVTAVAHGCLHGHGRGRMRPPPPARVRDRQFPSALAMSHRRVAAHRFRGSIACPRNFRDRPWAASATPTSYRTRPDPGWGCPASSMSRPLASRCRSGSTSASTASDSGASRYAPRTAPSCWAPRTSGTAKTSTSPSSPPTPRPAPSPSRRSSSSASSSPTSCGGPG